MPSPRAVCTCVYVPVMCECDPYERHCIHYRRVLLSDICIYCERWVSTGRALSVRVADGNSSPHLYTQIRIVRAPMMVFFGEKKKLLCANLSSLINC